MRVPCDASVPGFGPQGTRAYWSRAGVTTKDILESKLSSRQGEQTFRFCVVSPAIAYISLEYPFPCFLSAIKASAYSDLIKTRSFYKNKRSEFDAEDVSLSALTRKSQQRVHITLYRPYIL